MAEFWDILDGDRRLTGRVHERGIDLKTLDMKDGDYHLVVEIWTVCGGKVLLSQRHEKKHFPLLWECTGGSVVAGEDSVVGASRELAEETGIFAEPDKFVLIETEKKVMAFHDVYLYKADLPYPRVTCQDGETVDIRWCSPGEVREMIAGNLLVPSIADMFERLFSVLFANSQPSPAKPKSAR